MGVQGRKRRGVAGDDVVATVDPIAPEADHVGIEAVPLADYDAALVCTPNGTKLDLLDYLIGHGKHVLVEKPLLSDDEELLLQLATLAAKRQVVCYTAYNHRFEPHILRVKEVLEDDVLGPLYRVRLFYGNGTARDVRESAWRDTGAGVLPDLGSHLLDLLLFWFNAVPEDLAVWAAQRFENRSFDHVVCGTDTTPLIQIEMSLTSWRNRFAAEFVGERGSAFIDSLCKWGPSSLFMETRTLPSGRPIETSDVIVAPDPTWQAEYEWFVNACRSGTPTNMENDLTINRILKRLSVEALAAAAP